MPSRPLDFDPIAEARRQWDVHWGSEATPQMVAVTSIMRAQQILLARLNALLEPLDLTFPRYETLMVLYYSRQGEMPLGKLSDRLQVHRASVTNVIDKLEDRGYVTRVAHEQRPPHDPGPDQRPRVGRSPSGRPPSSTRPGLAWRRSRPPPASSCSRRSSRSGATPATSTIRRTRRSRCRSCGRGVRRRPCA